MKIKEAKTMRLIACDCGCRGVQFELRDDAGRVFAIANVPREVGVHIAEQIVEHALSDDGDAIGEVAGHA